MRARQPIPPEVKQLAAEQEEVITREQVLAGGFGRAGVDRLLRDGAWQRLASGVYYCAPVAPPWEAWAWGGVLLGGDEARLGGRAAGYLHEVVERAPEEIEVLVPVATGRPRVSGPWRFRRESPGVRSPRTTGSPPRLPIHDTVLDLAAGTRDPQRVVELVTVAAQTRRTNATQLLRALDCRKAHPHRALLVDLLAEVKAGVRSPLEREHLNKVERPHGLPVADRQLRRRDTEVDAWYKVYCLLVELDGRRGHLGLGRFRDMRRDNRSTTDGLATLRYGAYDIFGSPCEVARQVGENLSLRGWAGPFVSCRRCRPVT
ncbi:MAG: hypothetical protein ACLGIF_09115 [Actinomycetes bacterium]